MQRAEALLSDGVGGAGIVDFWRFHPAIHCPGRVLVAILLGNTGESQPNVGVRLVKVSCVHCFQQQLAGLARLSSLGIDTGDRVQNGKLPFFERSLARWDTSSVSSPIGPGRNNAYQA